PPGAAAAWASRPPRCGAERRKAGRFRDAVPGLTPDPMSRACAAGRGPGRRLPATRGPASGAAVPAGRPVASPASQLARDLHRAEFTHQLQTDRLGIAVEPGHLDHEGAGAADQVVAEIGPELGNAVLDRQRVDGDAAEIRLPVQILR